MRDASSGAGPTGLRRLRRNEKRSHSGPRGGAQAPAACLLVFATGRTGGARRGRVGGGWHTVRYGPAGQCEGAVGGAPPARQPLTFSLASSGSRTDGPE